MAPDPLETITHEEIGKLKRSSFIVDIIDDSVIAENFYQSLMGRKIDANIAYLPDGRGVVYFPFEERVGANSAR